MYFHQEDNKLKKVFIWLLKAFTAGLAALCIANLFCFFYYNLPVHYTNKSGTTDYYWDADHFSSRGTEGFALTKTDENGFVNTFPYKKETVDVLIMGSSHTEGFNVNEDENYTYLLNSKFLENGLDKYAYSIGTSGHGLLRNLKNLENALEAYRPQEYVVIETTKIDFDTEDLEQLNSGTYETLKSYDSGFIYALQKIDYFRLVHTQYNSFIKSSDNEDDSPSQVQTEAAVTDEYVQLLDTAIRNAAKTASDKGCTLVVFYSPSLEIDYNGNVIKREYTQVQQSFITACGKYGVEFIDMSEAFTAMYETTDRLPFGFSNTAVGTGHINKYGHACVAQELYDFMIGG